jgi:DNA-binding NarL/FixJ family response regulator
MVLNDHDESYLFTSTAKMKRHIFLIDENENELKTFMEALNEIDDSFVCTYAGNAKEALEMLHSLEPDFVFLNYCMPATGLPLVSVIKNETRLKHAKIFIYSASIGEEINKMAKLLGASGCIEKQESTSKLTHALRAIFAGDLMPSYAFLGKS